MNPGNKILSLGYVFLLIAFVFFVFSYSIRFPIMDGWDDVEYILSNQHLQLSLNNIIYYFSKPYNFLYTPLTMISYMIDYRIWGLNSLGYHLQNIFWHVVATLSIFYCFRHFKVSVSIAFFISLFFAVHPQRVESVVWLSERKDVLCAAFYFSSILMYLKKDKNRHYLSISCLLFVFSLLAKPMAVSLPFILLIIEIYKNRKPKLKYYIKKLWFFFAIISISIPITYFSQAVSSDQFSITRIICILLYNIAWYIYSTLIPNNLNPLYPQLNFSSIIIFIFISYSILLILFLFLVLKKREFIQPCILIALCYLITLAPVSGIVPFGIFDNEYF